MVYRLKVNNQPLSFEVDTGAALSLISEETKEKFFSSVAVHPAGVVLKTYMEQIEVVGEMEGGGKTYVEGIGCLRLN